MARRTVTVGHIFALLLASANRAARRPYGNVGADLGRVAPVASRLYVQQQGSAIRKKGSGRIA